MKGYPGREAGKLEEASYSHESRTDAGGRRAVESRQHLEILAYQRKGKREECHSHDNMEKRLGGNEHRAARDRRDGRTVSLTAGAAVGSTRPVGCRL